MAKQARHVELGDGKALLMEHDTGTLTITFSVGQHASVRAEPSILELEYLHDELGAFIAEASVGA